MYEHCIIKLNESHVLLTGGRSTNTRTDFVSFQLCKFFFTVCKLPQACNIFIQKHLQNHFYIYNFIEDSWTELAPMQESRFGHGCGLVTLEDGTQELVVAGGHTTSVEIYSFENQNWRYLHRQNG